MINRNDKNESIGIIAVIILVILAAVGLYYFFAHRPHAVMNEIGNTYVPVETPAPVRGNTPGGN